MEKRSSKKRVLFSSMGSFWFAVFVMLFVQFVLHNDFWNWGEQNIYFGWMPGEFLYRFLMTVVGVPVIHTVLQKITWPVPKE